MRLAFALGAMNLRRVFGAVVLGAIVAGFGVGAAVAAPGQCEVSGFDMFDCDVALDGGGLTFALPDGQTFAFALVDDGEGLGYLIEPDARPGQRPDELGTFTPIEGEPGCWAGDRKVERFCVLVAQ